MVQSLEKSICTQPVLKCRMMALWCETRYRVGQLGQLISFPRHDVGLQRVFPQVVSETLKEGDLDQGARMGVHGERGL